MIVKRMAMLLTDPNPWAAAPVSLWRNNDLDPHKFALREALAREQAREHKISNAIQFGRIYGLGSQHYEMIRQKKLEAVLARRSVTDKVW
jgi:hypothetical protein